MKASLHFTLPEESEEFDNAQKGGRYRSVVEEMDNYLRARLKYEELSKDIHDALQAARDKLWELRSDD